MVFVEFLTLFAETWSAKNSKISFENAYTHSYITIQMYMLRSNFLEINYSGVRILRNIPMYSKKNVQVWRKQYKICDNEVHI